MSLSSQRFEEEGSLVAAGAAGGREFATTTLRNSNTKCKWLVPANLPSDVLLLIFEWAALCDAPPTYLDEDWHRSDTFTVKSACTVCRAWSFSAQRVLHSSVFLQSLDKALAYVHTSQVSPSLTSRTTSMIVSPKILQWGEEDRSTVEQKRKLATSFMEALASAPNVRKLAIGVLECSVRQTLLHLLSECPLQSLVYDPRGGSAAERTLEHSVLKIDDLPFVLSLPNLRQLSLLGPHLTTLIIYCNNVHVLLGVVKATGRTLLYAKIYTERNMPPEEAIAAWSTTTESLIAWEHQSNPAEVELHSVLWVQQILPRFKRLERLSIVYAMDVDSSFVSLAPPSLRTIQFCIVRSGVPPSLVCDWWMESSSWRQNVDLLVLFAEADEDDVDEVEESSWLPWLEEKGLRVEMVDWEWSTEELFFGLESGDRLS
ncbi:hypothetical protein BCR35DRAFT_335398 [Leucosporidium creatinivorum]|uniref:F-box domain-containing protein n=1 Tax=Leucosporidium creatinivorum TaxID=106004 RepID=A0A1Y2DC99_9BASI|nr:hypothetical protein BCR35DRAFT_335398 [Leucosporidium creatinivorum]